METSRQNRRSRVEEEGRRRIKIQLILVLVGLLLKRFVTLYQELSIISGVAG